jgi:hypothetical protein
MKPWLSCAGALCRGKPQQPKKPAKHENSG